MNVTNKNCNFFDLGGDMIIRYDIYGWLDILQATYQFEILNSNKL